MEPILIFKNENAIDNAQSHLYEPMQVYQDIVDRFNALELGDDKKLSGGDLSLFVQNPKAFIVDKITQGESLSIGSMTISKEKAFEILELPEQLHSILREVEKITIGNHSSGYQVRNVVTNFTINSGVVEFTEKFKNDIEKTNSIFITTPAQKAAWNLMQEIASNLNDLRAITSKGGYTLTTDDMTLFFGCSERKDNQHVNYANPEAIKKLGNI